MEQNTSEKRYRVKFQAARSKVLIAFVLAIAALLLFWLGSRFVFGATLHNMEELSKPNEKLKQVNTLFQEFTQVDQMQRRIALQDKKGRRAKISALSDTLLTHIEALRAFYDYEDWQYRRLDSIQTVMEKRGSLFWDFIQERDHLMSSSMLVEQTEIIAQLIAAYEPLIDSSTLTQTYRQITKTTTPPDTVLRIVTLERQGNIFKRLFGKKNLEEVEIEEAHFSGEPEIVVEEMVDSTISSLSVAQKDTLLPWLEEQLWEMIEYHQAQAARMGLAESEFLKASNALMSEILFMLYEIEGEELRNIEANQRSLSKLIDNSFDIFNWLLVGILFSLACMIYLILVDFSKSRRYRAQLVQAKEEAERLGQVKERFLSNMSHEIRTPLQSIIGFAEQMQKQSQPASFEQQAIHQSARHLLQIVNEILDYNRLVSGRFQLDAQPFDMLKVLEEVGANMKAQAEAKGLEFISDLDVSPGLLLRGDAFRLRQILYNLLGNSVKFTEAGRIRLGAQARQYDGGCQFELEVEDTGIGIPVESLQQIFNQFEQAAGLDSQRYGGTGLGLSIVNALVEIQGGTIRVESRPGHGSLFALSLPYPIAQEASPDLGQTPVMLPSLSEKPAGAIYIVDDDPLVLRLCEQILISCGFQTATFLSAATLLKEADLQDGDLVLTDIRLPGMTGYGLLEALRASEAGVAVIAMTAQALPEERRAMRQAGFDDLLVKPFTERELLSTVSRFAASAEEQAPGEEPTAHAPLALALDEDLAALFIEESGKDLAALSAALEAEDAAAAAEALHRLAGRSGQFGFSAWYQSSRRLEVRLREHLDLEACRQEITLLHKEMADALAAEQV